MRAYGRLGKYLAIYVECAKELGIKPLWRYDTLDGEIIFQAPYCTVIVTGAERLKQEKDRQHGIKQNEKRDRRLSRAPKGIAKN